METIAAIATPPGEGGIAIIRISGSEALEIADRLFSGRVKSYETHTAHFGVICDLEEHRIDEALLILMRAPRSYTGEDIVELQCHGGMVASRKVLEAVLAAGARAAGPGEFTFRAFMNGKLDLAQAEAVQRLIGAKNTQAFDAAGEHLEGELSKQVSELQRDLVKLAAILEAWVDFPEEGLAFITREEMTNGLEAALSQMENLLTTFHDGRRMEHGIALCIAGPPNAGKSSLMNALLDQERAIVTPIAGTTRDLLQEELTLNGLHFRLIDTAGIRETDEIIEKEGIRRTKKAMEEADLVLFVLDATSEEIDPDYPLEKTIVVRNKIDLPCLPPEKTFPHEAQISAKERIGLDGLKKKIDDLIWEKGAPPRDQVVISTLRHKEALEKASEYVQAVVEGLKTEVSAELLTRDLRDALTELGRIIGTNISEDILSSIFSQFCVGK